MDLPQRAVVATYDPTDGIGTLTLADGSSVRFGRSACRGDFSPAAGLPVQVTQIAPHPRGGLRATAIEPTAETVAQSDAARDSTTKSAAQAAGEARSFGMITVLLGEPFDGSRAALRALLAPIAHELGGALSLDDDFTIRVAGHDLRFCCGAAEYPSAALDERFWPAGAPRGQGFLCLLDGLPGFMRDAALQMGGDAVHAHHLAAVTWRLRIAHALLVRGAVGVVVHRAGHVLWTRRRLAGAPRRARRVVGRRAGRPRDSPGRRRVQPRARRARAARRTRAPRPEPLRGRRVRSQLCRVSLRVRAPARAGHVARRARGPHRLRARQRRAGTRQPRPRARSPRRVRGRRTIGPSSSCDPRPGSCRWPRSGRAPPSAALRTCRTVCSSAPRCSAPAGRRSIGGLRISVLRRRTRLFVFERQDRVRLAVTCGFGRLPQPGGHPDRDDAHIEFLVTLAPGAEPPLAALAMFGEMLHGRGPAAPPTRSAASRANCTNHGRLSVRGARLGRQDRPRRGRGRVALRAPAHVGCRARARAIRSVWRLGRADRRAPRASPLGRARLTICCSAQKGAAPLQRRWYRGRTMQETPAAPVSTLPFGEPTPLGLLGLAIRTTSSAICSRSPNRKTC